MDEKLTTDIIEEQRKRDINDLDDDLKIPAQSSFLIAKSVQRLDTLLTYHEDKIKSLYLAEELEAVLDRLNNALRYIQDVAGDAALSLGRIQTLQDTEKIYDYLEDIKSDLWLANEPVRSGTLKDNNC